MFDVFRVVSVKINVIWVVTACNLVDRDYGGTCVVHLYNYSFLRYSSLLKMMVAGY